MPYLLACDNCVQGDPTRYYGHIALALLVSVLFATAAWLIGLRLREVARKAMFGAAMCFLVASPAGLILVATPLPPNPGGHICGSGLKASLLRGVPDDSALEDEGSACKRAGQRGVRAGLAVGTVAGLAGVALVTFATVCHRRPQIGSDTPYTEPWGYPQ